MIVIGVAGKPGAGRTELAEYLRGHYGFQKIATDEIVREFAKREGLGRPRDDLREMAHELKARRGEDYLADAIVRRIGRNGWERVVVNGLRTPVDVTTLRERFAEEFALVRVDVADPQVRFRRSIERDDTRESVTFADFLRADRREAELFDIERTLAMADTAIRNDGTVEDFRRSIDAVIENELLRRRKAS